MKRLLLAVTVLALAAAAAAQSHTRDPLVLGQPTAFRLDGLPQGAFAAFLLSFAGAGNGPCLGPPANLCLGVLDPLLVGPLVLPDPTGRAAMELVVPASLAPAPLHSQGLWLVPAGVVAASNAVSGPIETLAAFDDGFDGPGLGPQWRIHNPHLLQWSVAGGELHVQPTAGGPNATWYADGEGPLVYRLVTGDFAVWAAVRSYRLSNPALPPPANFDMAGLSVRDPRSDQGPHDWLHVAVGGGVPATPVVVEDKSTDDSVSNLLLHPIAAPRGQVRIERRGATVSLSYRPDATAAWQLLRAHHRPDLGATLQVGMNVFSWSPSVDIGGSFDAVWFAN